MMMPPKTLTGDDQDAGDRIAAHEFGRAVHRAEERAFLLQLAAAVHRLTLVDQPGREVGVDGHLLAGNGIEGEARAHFRDTRRALGDHHEIHGDQDHEDDRADDEVAAHHEAGEARDHVASAAVTLGAVGRGSGGSWRC